MFWKIVEALIFLALVIVFFYRLMPGTRYFKRHGRELREVDPNIDGHS